MKWSKKATKQFLIIIVLFGFGSTYLILDYCSIPSTESLMWDGGFNRVTDMSYGEPDKCFKIGLGDGFISNIEHIFIHLSLMFGCFECFDFVSCFEPKNDNDVKEYFRKIINNWKNKRDKEDKIDEK